MGYDVDLFTVPVFRDKKTGVVAALDDKVRELQGEDAA